MMKFALLLILLWSLVEVHSQTAPYLTFMGETLPNNSYVDLSALGEFDNNASHVVCHTDLTTCCGGGGINNRGYWYLPNGDVLPGAAGGPGAADNPIVLKRDIQMVSLIRGTGPGDVPSGIYHCVIETNAVKGPNNSPEDITGETVYVGVYSTGGIYNIGGIRIIHNTNYMYIHCLAISSTLMPLCVTVYMCGCKLLYLNNHVYRTLFRYRKK